MVTDNREASFDVDGLEIGTAESLEQARRRVREQLALDNPIVFKAIVLWRQGIVPWEEALILMVEGMDKAYRSMQEEATRADYPGEFGNRIGHIKVSGDVLDFPTDLFIKVQGGD